MLEERLMSEASSKPQSLLLIGSTDRGLRDDSSWLISLFLHAVLIALVGWFWNAERLRAPELRIDVALVDGDSQSGAGEPAPQPAPQETPKEPVRETRKSLSMTRIEREATPTPRSAPVQEHRQSDAPSEAQKAIPEARLPEPTAPAQPAPPPPVVASDSLPAEPSVPVTPPAPAAVEQATEEHQALPVVSEPSPTPPMIAHVAPLEATESAAPAAELHQADGAPQENVQRSASDPNSRAAAVSRADYGWLAEALWSRVEKGKRYPHQARINQWEGKVVVRAVIREDGELVGLDVARSSGHSVLDEDAMASVKHAFPLRLPRSLGKTQVALQIPINYQLDR
jgi:protein TonB